MAKFLQISREENTKADSLAKETFADDVVDDHIKVQYILSIDVLEIQQIDGEAKLDYANRVLPQGWATPRG